MGRAPRRHQAAPRARLGETRKRPTPAAATPMPWQPWVCTAALVIATAVVLHPVLRAEFLSWDDTAYVSMNKLLRAPDALRKIWDPFEPTRDQYYPLVFTSYWAEYQLWQTDSTAYHAVNLGLHLANVVLVFFLIEALGASRWVAVGAAGVFAFHPLQVASVAWIAELKNVLSGFFFLIAFLLYLHHRRTDSWWSYSGCLLAFTAALLSKTQTVTLPVSMALAESLLRAPARLRPLRWTAVARRLAPMLAVGLLAAVVTALVEHGNIAWARIPTAGERMLIAANAPWFYVMKFLVPVGLVPVYGKWDLAADRLVLALGVLAWVPLVALVVRHRDRIGALPLWGMAQFLVALCPVLGLVPFGLQQHAFVANHFMYRPIIGIAVATAVWADRLGDRFASARGREIVTALGLVVLAAYGVRAYRQSLYWQNDETFWQRVVAYNPESVPAQQSLGYYYRRRGRWITALPYLRTTAELRPENASVFRDYAGALRHVEGPRAAIDVCNQKLQAQPGMTAAYLERAESFEALGRVGDAVADYERVLQQAAAGSQERQVAQRAYTRLTARTGAPR